MSSFDGSKSSKQVNYAIDNLRILFNRGAHFVICTEDKKPSFSKHHNQGKWQDFRPTMQDLHFHIVGRGSVGVKPVSLGLCCIDVDEGDPVRVLELSLIHI